MVALAALVVTGDLRVFLVLNLQHLAALPVFRGMPVLQGLAAADLLISESVEHYWSLRAAAAAAAIMSRVAMQVLLLQATAFKVAQALQALRVMVVRQVVPAVQAALVAMVALSASALTAVMVLKAAMVDKVALPVHRPGGWVALVAMADKAAAAAAAAIMGERAV
jgi:hypothetical protein